MVCNLQRMGSLWCTLFIYSSSRNEICIFRSFLLWSEWMARRYSREEIWRDARTTISQIQFALTSFVFIHMLRRRFVWKSELFNDIFIPASMLIAHFRICEDNVERIGCNRIKKQVKTIRTKLEVLLRNRAENSHRFEPANE